MFLPRFPKPKDESWFLVIGNIDDNELLAMKRLQLGPSTSKSCLNQVTFFTPEKCGRVIYTVFLVSDSYLGLDQQYDIYLDVVDDIEGGDVREISK